MESREKKTTEFAIEFAGKRSERKVKIIIIKIINDAVIESDLNQLHCYRVILFFYIATTAMCMQTHTLHCCLIGTKHMNSNLWLRAIGALLHAVDAISETRQISDN
jgi:hypothetical protein